MKKLLIIFIVTLNIALISAAESLDDEAVSWLQNYLKIDTVTPPGNESRADEYIATII